MNALTLAMLAPTLSCASIPAYLSGLPVIKCSILDSLPLRGRRAFSSSVRFRFVRFIGFPPLSLVYVRLGPCFPTTLTPSWHHVYSYRPVCVALPGLRVTEQAEGVFETEIFHHKAENQLFSGYPPGCKIVHEKPPSGSIGELKSSVYAVSYFLMCPI